MVGELNSVAVMWVTMSRTRSSFGVAACGGYGRMGSADIARRWVLMDGMNTRSSGPGALTVIGMRWHGLAVAAGGATEERRGSWGVGSGEVRAAWAEFPRMQEEPDARCVRLFAGWRRIRDSNS